MDDFARPMSKIEQRVDALFWAAIKVAKVAVDQGLNDAADDADAIAAWAHAWTEQLVTRRTTQAVPAPARAHAYILPF